MTGLSFVSYKPKDLLNIIKKQFNPSDKDLQLAEHLLDKGYPPIYNIEVLALILGISTKLLTTMATQPQRYYRTFYLKKKSGGSRRIDTPRIFLKVVQWYILFHILYNYKRSPYIAGFVPHRSILHNASFHKKKRFLINIDIKDFFPSIKSHMVNRIFALFEFPEKVVEILTGLTTLNGSLPQGAPTSPYLANIYCSITIDSSIKSSCDMKGIIYSRYADDMSFSSDDKIKFELINFFRKLLNLHGLSFNEDKIRILGPGQRRTVTGMVINQKVHPPRYFRRRLRAMFHQAALNPANFVDSYYKLVGYASYVHIYDEELGNDYLQIAAKVRDLLASEAT